MRIVNEAVILYWEMENREKTGRSQRMERGRVRRGVKEGKGGQEDGERKRGGSSRGSRVWQVRTLGLGEGDGTHLGSLLRMAAAGELGLMFFTGLSFTWVCTTAQK